MRRHLHARPWFAANHLLDAIEREAAHGLAVDRIDHLAGLHAGARCRHMLDRLNDDPAVFKLVDVDADPAEVPAAERFVQPWYSRGER